MREHTTACLCAECWSGKFGVLVLELGQRAVTAAVAALEPVEPEPAVADRPRPTRRPRRRRRVPAVSPPPPARENIARTLHQRRRASAPASRATYAPSDERRARIAADMEATPRAPAPPDEPAPAAPPQIAGELPDVRATFSIGRKP